MLDADSELNWDFPIVWVEHTRLTVFDLRTCIWATWCVVHQPWIKQLSEASWWTQVMSLNCVLATSLKTNVKLIKQHSVHVSFGGLWCALATWIERVTCCWSDSAMLFSQIPFPRLVFALVFLYSFSHIRFSLLVSQTRSQFCFVQFCLFRFVCSYSFLRFVFLCLFSHLCYLRCAIFLPNSNSFWIKWCCLGRCGQIVVRGSGPFGGKSSGESTLNNVRRESYGAILQLNCIIQRFGCMMGWHGMIGTNLINGSECWASHFCLPAQMGP